MGAINGSWRPADLYQHLYDIQSSLPYDTTAQRLIAQDFVFLSNHDSFTGSRVATQLGGDTAKIKLAGSVYLLLSGKPVTYYGEEYGMQNIPGASGDDAIRGPMDWDEVTRQTNAPDSILQHYTGLFRIRNRYDALHAGRTVVVPSRRRVQFRWSAHHVGPYVVLARILRREGTRGHQLDQYAPEYLS